MAIDSRKSNGSPIFLGTGAPATGQDLTTLGDEIYKRGTRLVGSSAEREAYPHPVEGLLWGDTTEGQEYIYSSGVWVPVARGTGWVTVPSVSATIVTARRVLDMVYIKLFTGTRTYPTGATAVVETGNLPEQFRPTLNSDNVTGQMIMQSNAAASIYVTPGGTVGVINSTGASRSGGYGNVMFMV